MQILSYVVQCWESWRAVVLSFFYFCACWLDSVSTAELMVATPSQILWRQLCCWVIVVFAWKIHIPVVQHLKSLYLQFLLWYYHLFMSRHISCLHFYSPSPTSVLLVSTLSLFSPPYSLLASQFLLKSWFFILYPSLLASLLIYSALLSSHLLSPSIIFFSPFTLICLKF